MKAKANQEDLLARLEATIEANQEDLKGMMTEMEAKMESNQAETRSTVRAVQYELKETIQHGIRAAIQPIREELDEMTTCRKATEKTEPDPRMMQSTEEHQEIPNEDAAVMPVGEPRKRCRVQNLAAESHQKRTDRIWGNHGSRRKSAAVAGKCPVMQQWHGVREMFPEKFRQKTTVDCTWSWRPPE
jgi:DNA repair exonuclease SbcCD ATPase subunit